MKCISCKNDDATIEVTKCATEQGGKSWTGEFCQNCTRILWKEYGANPQVSFIFEELKR
jgi:protein-arginine kinase activator protein McsA